MMLFGGLVGMFFTGTGLIWCGLMVPTSTYSLIYQVLLFGLGGSLIAVPTGTVVLCMGMSSPETVLRAAAGILKG